MFRPMARRSRHDIESKAQIAPFRMLGQEGRRCPLNPALLAWRHRFEGFGEGAARLDFDGRDDLAALGYQIDFADRRAVAPRQDAPAGEPQQQRAAPLGRMAAKIGLPARAHFLPPLRRNAAS